jgi:hypothetical protein
MAMCKLILINTLNLVLLCLRLPQCKMQDGGEQNIGICEGGWEGQGIGENCIITRVFARRGWQNCERRLSIFTSVCPSSWKKSAATGRIFMKYDFEYFSKIRR